MGKVYARVNDGMVIEVFTVPAGEKEDGTPFTIEDCFSPEYVPQWIDADAAPGIAQFWTYDGTNFHAPANEVTS